MKQLSFLLILLMCCALYASAGTLKGKVTDLQGAPLPYATIYLEGTTLGANANGNGDYELAIAPGLYKVVCQYVGYKKSSFNLTITGNEVVQHSFSLKDESLEMKEVVVHASSEDPAYAIIRNAIKKRKFHLDQVRSFHTSIYLKGVVRSRALPKKVAGQKVETNEFGVDSMGKGVLYLTEEDADYYSDGDKEKTIIHSVHESGNKSGVGFSQFPSVITFYDNNVAIFGKSSRGFISPISDNALSYYKYKLLGEIREQGHVINKIQVKQKRAYEPCFNGIIYIVDDDWAIQSLNMTLTKQSGMDLADTLKVDQILLPLEKDTWVIKSQVLYFTINVLGFDVTASAVTVYNDQRVNERIPDSLFAGNIISQYDKTANKKDSSYWDNRPVPLEQDEKRDYVVKDSINKVITDPAYVDSVRRKQNKITPSALLLSGVTLNGKKYKNTYTFNSLLLNLNNYDDNIINYNTVEGYVVAPKLDWKHVVDTGRTLYGDVAVRYGFTNTHLNAIGRLYYLTRDRSWLNRLWLYGVEGGKYVFQYDPQNPVLPMFNTYRTLFAGKSDLKIYERTDAAAFVRRNYGNGFTWMLKASYQHRMPLNNSAKQYIFSGDQSKLTSNTPTSLLAVATAWEEHDAALLYASVSYKPGYTYTQYPDYKLANGSSWPRFTLTYDKGISGIFNSKVNFDKWRFHIQDDVSLRLFGLLRYNIGAGGFLNTNYVSFPDLIHLHGNRGVGYASPYMESFQMAPYYDLSNTASIYGEAHVEYHLNGLLSNKIPLLRQARYYLLLGGNAFYAGQSNYYTEAFVGIDNIGWKLIRVLRIDFVESWDSMHGSTSGIRFGLTLPRAQSSDLTHSEW